MDKEKEVQIKFKVEFLGKTFPEYSGLEELRHWCAQFHKSGLTPSFAKGTLGNLSFRTGAGKEEFLITASAVGFKDDLKTEDFVLVSSVDMKDMVVYAYGKRAPSSESMLHYAIYKAREDVNAVFHGHCRKMLDNSDKFGIQETEKAEPYGSPELVDSVLKLLGDNAFIIMKEHGFLSLGKTMDIAGGQALKILAECAG